MIKSNKLRLFFLESLGLLLLVLFTSTIMAQSTANTREKGDKYFDGFYIGLNAGYQNIFGGAFINELDVLAQKAGFVVEYSAGYRRQLFTNRLLIGAALQYGLTDGDLAYTHLDYQITYENNSQFGYSLQIGVSLRPRLLLFIYGNETKRSFDITIVNANGENFNQKDSQIFLKYGLGLEAAVARRLGINGTIGGVKTDYGDIETNRDVDNKLDFSLGIVYQF